MQDSYKQLFHPAVSKDLKKLDKPIRQLVYDKLDTIAQNPTINCDRLKGDLSGVNSHHFKHNGTEYRIAYRIDNHELVVFFISVATRENFYAILKRRIQ